MGPKYANVIVWLSSDYTRWCDQIVRSLTRAGIGYTEIDLLRCAVAQALTNQSADQSMDQLLINVFKQWVTIKEK